MALIPNLVRPADDRMVAGVCSGIARYLKVDTGLVRAVTALAVLFGGMSLWVYPLMWALMPDEGSDRAAVDGLVDQAKQWKASSDAKKAQTPTAERPQDVFNPYEEPRN
ncbi:PspC domain-containing protein [Luteococcus sp. Sow4_B9]|uniref:PspC domain-containing protein n=1 Tax=Luteococcus sp. Sow4_B9 TaxID=3438792 RepID=UPI003F9AAAED